MKRRIIPLIAATAMVLTVVSAVSAVEVYKFACADILSGGGQLTSTDPTTDPYDFGFNIQAAEPCKNVVYTLYVFETEAACELAQATGSTSTAFRIYAARGAAVDNDGFGQVAFTEADVSTSGTSLWVFATTSLGKTLFDTAPDPVDGCEEVGVDPPAGGKFN